LYVGDDKKLGGMLKKMNMTPINGIEEVNIFRETGEVIHITSPKSKNFSII
jgi:nascent polypeptide-associated complex subunit beta